MALSTPGGNDFFRFPLKDGLPSIQAIYENCSVRHCHLIQYALDHFGYEHDDIVVVMDGDVFALQPLSIRALLEEVPIAGINSEFFEKSHLWESSSEFLEKGYLWVPFIAFDPQRLPNVHELKFHVDLIDGVVCDTGSHSYHYLKNHPEVDYCLYPRRTATDFYPYDVATFARFGLEPLAYSSINWPMRMEFYIDYHFLHFCGGSGLHPERKFYDIANLMGQILGETLPVVQDNGVR